ncbi:MAG: hypothetical protein V4674_04235 [Patescibacteria group bacterium]
MERLRRYTSYATVLLLLFLAGGGYLFYRGFGSALRTSRGTAARTARYTNSLVGVDTYTTKQFLRSKRLEDAYKEAALSHTGEITDTAVVFRELGKGSWAEVNPQTQIPHEAVAPVLDIFEKYDARYSGQSIFEEIGIAPKKDSTGKPFYTISQQNLLMRALYNGTYMGREESESALSRLAETGAKIPSALPATLPFVRISWTKMPDTAGPGDFEHNSCGIGYDISKPFVLCIYAKATSPEALESFFTTIEERTYAELPFLYQ